jgi:sarcosine oxidase
VSKTCDVAIVGLGAMGSAAAYALTRRGQRVIGFDRFRPPHAFGSSHGESRIIREAYFEQPLYVPLVRRAYARWREIERESGRPLLLTCGLLSVGPPDSAIVRGARASADMHSVRCEELTASEVPRRFPAWRVPGDLVGIWEPGAGLLFPERCIETLLSLASARGATLAFEEPVVSWRVTGDAVEVRTATDRYHARRLVLAAGGWARDLAGDLDLPLEVERNAVHWFAPVARPEAFRPDRFPVFLLESAAAPGVAAYGCPDLGTGVKAAWHHQGEVTSADTVRRSVDAAEIDSVRAVLREFLPDANGECVKSTVCTYTNTPDLDFIIDTHPAHPQVLIASPCSGHGFKFSSAIGEILADLAVDGTSEVDLSPFRLSRFVPASSLPPRRESA